VIFGRPTLGGTIDIGTVSPDLIVRGIVTSALGFAAAAGDVSGDGIADLLVGLPTFGGIGVGGALAVINGSADLGGIVEVTTNVPGTHADVLVQTPAAGDIFGVSVSAGDFNGDGRSDFVGGAPGGAVGAASKTFVLFGRPTFPSFINLAKTTPNLTLLEAQLAEIQEQRPRPSRCVAEHPR
jgi:FG-GAP repeat